MLRPCLLIAMIVAMTVVAAADKQGDSNSANSPRPVESQLQDQTLLQEIAELQKQMGGSVLKNSILAVPSDPKGTPSQSVGSLKDPRANPLSIKSQRDLIVALQTKSGGLDKVANELEVLQNYRQADELRAIAGDLRQLARQLDHSEIGSPQNTAKEFQDELKALLRQDKKHDQKSAVVSQPSAGSTKVKRPNLVPVDSGKSESLERNTRKTISAESVNPS